MQSCGCFSYIGQIAYIITNFVNYTISLQKVARVGSLSQREEEGLGQVKHLFELHLLNFNSGGGE